MLILSKYMLKYKTYGGCLSYSNSFLYNSLNDNVDLITSLANFPLINSYFSLLYILNFYDVIIGLHIMVSKTDLFLKFSAF